jgi:hypothetical protein
MTHKNDILFEDRGWADAFFSRAREYGWRTDRQGLLICPDRDDRCWIVLAGGPCASSFKG